MPGQTESQEIFTKMLGSITENNNLQNPIELLRELEGRQSDLEAAFNKIWQEFIRGPGSIMGPLEENIGEIRFNLSALIILVSNTLSILEKQKIIKDKEGMMQNATEEALAFAQTRMQEEEPYEDSIKKTTKKRKTPTKKKTKK